MSIMIYVADEITGVEIRKYSVSSEDQIEEVLPGQVAIQYEGDRKPFEVTTELDGDEVVLVEVDPYEPTEEELLSRAKYDKCQLVNEKYETKKLAGYTFSDGPLEGKNLQTRNSDDMLSWVLLDKRAEKLISDGNPSITLSVRDCDNIIHEVEASDVVTSVDTVLTHWDDLRDHCWYLKDTINTQTSLEDVEAVDINSGW